MSSCPTARPPLSEHDLQKGRDGRLSGRPSSDDERPQASKEKIYVLYPRPLMRFVSVCRIKNNPTLDEIPSASALASFLNKFPPHLYFALVPRN